MPVPIWVALAAVKVAGVGAYYIHRKVVSAKQGESLDSQSNTSNKKDAE